MEEKSKEKKKVRRNVPTVPDNYAVYHLNGVGGEWKTENVGD